MGMQENYDVQIRCPQLCILSLFIGSQPEFEQLQINAPSCGMPVTKWKKSFDVILVTINVSAPKELQEGAKGRGAMKQVRVI